MIDNNTQYHSDDDWVVLKPEDDDFYRVVQVIYEIHHKGEVRTYRTTGFIYKAEYGEELPYFHAWYFSEGNGSCDCNRALYWGYAEGLSYDDIPERPCGNGAFRMKVINPKNGHILFDDTADVV